MGSVKRKTYTSPLPANAVVSGNSAKWTARDGSKRSGKVFEKDGKQYVRYQSATWYAKYRDADGTVKTVATGCRDKTAAHTQLAALMGEVENFRSGIISQPEAATAKQMSAGIEGHLTAYLADYLANQKGQGKRARVSAKHLVDAQRSLRLIVAECGFASMREIDRTTVQAWVSKQIKDAERDWSNKTINSYVSALRAFCTWAAVKSNPRRLKENPLDRFPMLDVTEQKNPRRVLTTDELERLLTVARLRPPSRPRGHATF